MKPCWLTHPGVRRRWRWRRREGTWVHRVVNINMAKPRYCTTHAVRHYRWNGMSLPCWDVTWTAAWSATCRENMVRQLNSFAFVFPNQGQKKNWALLLIKRTASVFLSLPTSFQTLCSLLILSCIWAHYVKLIYFTQDETRTFWNHVSV